MARLAKSLETLRSQINEKYPNRSKASDGWIGDAAHQSKGGAAASQHNPLPNGVVCAIDITEDLSVGLNCNQLMAELDASDDDRIFYLIHDGLIDNSNDVTTKYTGPNPHNKHLHISVQYANQGLYDDARKWNIPMLAPKVAPIKAPAATGRPVVKLGSKGQAVKDLQARLNRDYYYSNLVVDGDFGPATDKVVREFQRRAKLTVDGIVGPATWAKLGL